MLEKIIPDIKMSETEETLVAIALSEPSVKKYMRAQAMIAIASIAQGAPDEGESDSAYLRRAAEVRGQLQVFQALLNIEKPQDVEPTSPQ